MVTKIQRKGFTLIELLVVIAIIGLLSTLAVVALGNAQQRARDSKRLADIKQIQTALALYYDDNAYYPYHAFGAAIALGTGGVAEGNKINDSQTIQDLADATTPTFMGRIPGDPTGTAACGAGLSFAAAFTLPGGSTSCQYTYKSNGTAVGTTNSQYAIGFGLEGAASGFVVGVHCASETGVASDGTCTH